MVVVKFNRPIKNEICQKSGIIGSTNLEFKGHKIGKAPLSAKLEGVFLQIHRHDSTNPNTIAQNCLCNLFTSTAVSTMGSTTQWRM